ncbi:TIGR00730 family Rossman fold protein [Peptoniphilus sp. KCTC 25270]|uniref:LOG family protein n=1 Tax=Peptoniphilus sp. KCTC 25270 TaxID=2897414 RepID=UPI001E57E7CF|nr:TIGR00730 family Rossman fold protein [Peptoniphilus sp. KCTC 25270]MCD1147498.1 TIGR00730 family Rossman fold protein [Peptoniphilus sp. KCTC 25270]
MNITVYCGSHFGKEKSHKEMAIKLGKWIAKKNHRLIYGGRKSGIMGIVADAVLENGGETIGVIPKFLAERTDVHPQLTECILVETMRERKSIMIEKGDVFIALPGGPGTLEEISEVISWVRLGQKSSPCILLNVGGYYDPLEVLFDRMVEYGFLTEEERNQTLFTENLEKMEEFVENYRC